jgi:hypothetical protein
MKSRFHPPLAVAERAALRGTDRILNGIGLKSTATIRHHDVVKKRLDGAELMLGGGMSSAFGNFETSGSGAVRVG